MILLLMILLNVATPVMISRPSKVAVMSPFMILLYFAAPVAPKRLSQTRRQPVEHEQLTWCRPENFNDLTKAAADLPILREIYASHGA